MVAELRCLNSESLDDAGKDILLTLIITHSEFSKLTKMQSRMKNGISTTCNNLYTRQYI